jgi:hypothetical protein
VCFYHYRANAQKRARVKAGDIIRGCRIAVFDSIQSGIDSHDSHNPAVNDLLFRSTFVRGQRQSTACDVPMRRTQKKSQKSRDPHLKSRPRDLEDQRMFALGSCRGSANSETIPTQIAACNFL